MGTYEKRTLLGDRTLLLQITLVGNDDDGEVILVLDAQDLLLEGHDFFEGLARRNGVDEQESLAGSHVLFSHSRVFLLAGRIQDIQQSDFIIDHTLLAVGICWRKKVPNQLCCLTGREGPTPLGKRDTIRAADETGGGGAFEVLTFNCWVVLVHEVTLDQLDGQARLSDATTTDNHQLVFS